MVIANGEPPSDALLREMAGRAELVVAADGGADVAAHAGVVIDAATGDLDSISEAARAALAPDALVVGPNRTGSQKAVNLCITRGARRP